MKTKAMVATLLVAAAANVEAYFASPYPRKAVSLDESDGWIAINGNAWLRRRGVSGGSTKNCRKGSKQTKAQGRNVSFRIAGTSPLIAVAVGFVAFSPAN
jgi:hypothetical protein